MPPALREQTNHQGRRTRRCRSIEIAAVATAIVGQCYSTAKIPIGAPERKMVHCLLQPWSAASWECNTREEFCESRTSMPFAFDGGGPPTMLGQLVIPDAWNSARFGVVFANRHAAFGGHRGVGLLLLGCSLPDKRNLKGFRVHVKLNRGVLRVKYLKCDNNLLETFAYHQDPRTVVLLTTPKPFDMRTDPITMVTRLSPHLIARDCHNRVQNTRLGTTIPTNDPG
jgi:hypothetical protein